MKKIILLTIIVLLMTGCYDYKELNDLAIISGIAIDYSNNKYIINLEILNDNTKDEKSYYIEGTGKTIKKAFNNASSKINHTPFYSHIKVMIINSNVKINSIVKYIIKNNDYNNDFYIAITKENAKDILHHQTNQEKIVSENIYYLLKSKTTFEEFISNYYNPYKKTYLPLINISNNDLIINKKYEVKNDNK